MRLSDSEQQRTKVVINSIILAISLYGMSQREYSFQQTSFAEKFFIDMMAPIQKYLSGIQSSTSNYVEYYVANINASKENEELKNKVSELKTEIFGYQELAKESERLKGLLNYGQEIVGKKVVAKVISWDASDDFKVIRIDKGLNQGLKLQSAVTTAEGLVGYIYRITNNYADVMTILDANNRVDAVVERVRSHGVIEGYGKNRAIMKYVSRTEPIILNDMVLTAGLGNIYPKGIKIGYISKIERESYGITQHVEITPIVNFSKLEEVLVVIQDNDDPEKSVWKSINKDEKVEGSKK